MLNEPFLKITNGPRPPYEIERPQMTIEFKIDQQLLGDGVKSADVAAVHVAVGDTVESGQIVMELETEKAVMELPCPHAGKIAKILVKKGDTITPGQAVLSIEGEANGCRRHVKAVGGDGTCFRCYCRSRFRFPFSGQSQWRRQGGDREGNARQVRCDA
jgi:hypothetical protein